MTYVALDIGSSFMKGAILDTAEMCARDFTQITTPPNIADAPERYEVDGEALFRAAKQMLDALLEREPEAKGVMICTQMHGGILTDSGFRPVTPYISWQDRASLVPVDGKTTVERLSELLPARLMERSGVPVKANLAMCSLVARGNVPAGAYFNTIGGYVISRLTGEHVCHIQNAAPTGMTDVVEGAWQREVIEIAGLDGLVFPEIKNDVSVCGVYAHNGREYPVYPDLGDQQACVLGALLRPETDLSVNIGTAGLISSACAEFERGAYETRPYFDGMYLKTVSGLSGGRRMDALVNEIAAGGMSKDEVWAMVTCLYPGLYAVARWQQMAQKTYEEMGAEYRDASRRISENFERIVFSGGCVGRNPALREWLIRETGISTGAGAMGMDSMLGMLQLALIADGTAADITETRRIMEDRYEKGEDQ